MELVDVYDSDKKPTGRVHRRGKPLAKGDRILVVCAWVTDGNGHLLLTLRAPEKPSCPNCWENSGGGALAGETSLEAIARELREETGIDAPMDAFTYIDTSRTSDAFFDLYHLIYPIDLKDLVLQPGETVDAKWVTLDQMEEMIRAGVVARPIARRFHRHRAYLEKLVWKKTP